MLIMAFFLYCFVHDAFDQPWPTQGVAAPHIERGPVEPVSASTTDH
jgi:hypothetical protein